MLLHWLGRTDAATLQMAKTPANRYNRHHYQCSFEWVPRCMLRIQQGQKEEGHSKPADSIIKVQRADAVNATTSSVRNICYFRVA
jgi:hypothetical protein